VIGTHPHVIEPIEWVDDTLVYYSIGNFVNWTSGTGEGTANRMVGAVAEVTVGMEDGEAQITDWGVEPVVCHVESGFGGVTVYPLSEYTEYLAEKNEIVKQDPAFSLEYCKELVRQVFGF
jgi:poly-gamma-glutamate synthesis protein (capsule biosynthesis protein)